MKFVIFFCLLMVPAIALSQDFKFRKPDMAQIQAAGKESGEDAVYIYLIRNYEPLSEPFDVTYDDDFEDLPLCSFRQKFENGIMFYINSCGEAKGLTITLSLPKASLDNVRQWIEEIHTTYGIQDTKNIWDAERKAYKPEGGGAGCRYEIKDLPDKTLIEIYCGC